MEHKRLRQISHDNVFVMHTGEIDNTLPELKLFDMVKEDTDLDIIRTWLIYLVRMSTMHPHSGDIPCASVSVSECQCPLCVVPFTSNIRNLVNNIYIYFFEKVQRFVFAVFGAMSEVFRERSVFVFHLGHYYLNLVPKDFTRIYKNKKGYILVELDPESIFATLEAPRVIISIFWPNKDDLRSTVSRLAIRTGFKSYFIVTTHSEARILIE